MTRVVSSLWNSVGLVVYVMSEAKCQTSRKPFYRAHSRIETIIRNRTKRVGDHNADMASVTVVQLYTTLSPF